MKTTTLVLLACLGPASCVAGNYSSESTITATLTVGATSSCTSSHTEIPVPATMHDQFSIDIASVTVTCPGAEHTYLGLVGANGLTADAITSDSTPYGDTVPGPYWMTTLADWRVDNSAFIRIAVVAAVYLDNTKHTAKGLPDSVLYLGQSNGSSGTFTIYMMGKCGTPTCSLNTGSYTYQMKMFGYWA